MFRRSLWALGVMGSLLGCPSVAPPVGADGGSEAASDSGMGTSGSGSASGATESGTSTGVEVGTSSSGGSSSGSDEAASEASTSNVAEGSTAGDEAPSASEGSSGESSLGLESSSGVAPNVAPELAELTLTVDGVRVSASVEATDIDGEVRFIEVDWGDQQPERIAYEGPDTVLSHDYPFPTRYRIEVAAVDDDDERSAAVVREVTSRIPAGEIASFPFSGEPDDELGAVTVIDGVASYETDRFGMGARALDLFAEGNSDEGVLVSVREVPVTATFTVSVWVFFTNACGPCTNELRLAGFGRWFNIFSMAESNSVSFGLLGEVPDVGDAPATLDAPLESGVWHHLVGVLEASGGSYAARLYWNGTLAATSSVATPVPRRPDCRFYIGPRPDDDDCSGSDGPEFQNFPGRLDDVRVYSRALSEIEVRALFHEGEYR